MSYYSDIDQAKAEIEELIRKATIQDKCLSLKKLLYDSVKLKVSQKFVMTCLNYLEEKDDICIQGDLIIPLRVKEYQEKAKAEMDKVLSSLTITEDESSD